MKWKLKAKLGQEKGKTRRQEIIETLLLNRGISLQKADQFFKPPHPADIKSDSFLDIEQLAKAMARVKKALQKGEKIIVYGDYDTDGICATAIVWETLAHLGAQVMPFIAKREEGYGLKSKRIEEFAQKGVSLVITVDQGIVCQRQVEFANEKGVDVIITDHHESEKTLPKASAIIHTTKLAGCGVAWFFSREILKSFKKAKSKNYLLDLAAIGTITDMVSLLGVNRSIARHGLKALTETNRKGLKFLYQKAGIDKKNIRAWEVGFLIGPRINASGRMDDPMDALRLLCTIDSKRANALAEKINLANQERQLLTEQIVEHARGLWQKEASDDPLIFVYHKTYEHGVIGLAASRIKDEFCRPTVVLAPRKDHWVASARSIENFSIIEAIRQCSALVDEHGGHKLAAGFSVSSQKIKDLKLELVKIAKQSLKKEDLEQTLEIDFELKLSDLSFELVKDLSLFEPFGVANPSPVFALKDLIVLSANTMGVDKSHLKLLLSDARGEKAVEAVFFKGAWFLQDLDFNKKIKVAFNLTINEFNSRKSLQLVIKDAKCQN